MGLKGVLFRNYSFRTKLIAAFLLASTLPLVALQAFTNYQTGKAMRDKMDELMQINLMQTAKSLESTLSSYRDLVFLLFTDADIFELTNGIIHDVPEKILYGYELQDKLIHYAYTKKGIRSISVLMQSGNVVSFDKEADAMNGMWPEGERLKRLPLYRTAMSRENEVIITSPEAVESIHNNERYVFHLARKITNLQPGNTNGVGVLVITLYESVLNNAASVAPANIDSFNVLVGEGGKVVSALDKGAIGLTVGQLAEKGAIINRYAEKVNGWTIVNVTEPDDLFAEMDVLQRIGWLAGLTAVFVSGIMIYYFSGRLTESIRKVVKAMKMAQRGSLNVQIEERNKDELAVIATNFNEMMARLGRLMHETTLANEKQKEAEIRALEAQINPHFLYNTLDSINWMAIEKNEHDISRMLNSLAKILRYSISESNRKVSVREELEWLRQYVFLQQHRFNDSFECRIECDPELQDAKIYKLLLQPFIENAIVHGFSKVRQGGLLQIDLRLEEDGRFSVRIEDNGHGMDGGCLQALLHGKGPAAGSGRSGLGIRNVLDRIRMYYGCQVDWTITSEPGNGTRIVCYLPLER